MGVQAIASHRVAQTTRQLNHRAGSRMLLRFPIPQLDPMPMRFREPVDLAALNASSRDTLIAQLGIVFTEAGDDWLRATMPVDTRTKQPYGLLHGGASVVLAETLGSSAGNLCVDMTTQMCVGLEINANHLRAAYQDVVIGTARPVHVGRSTHVWDITIDNPAGKRVCVSRLTLAVVARTNG